jgi:hypothetical protein
MTLLPSFFKEDADIIFTYHVGGAALSLEEGRV